jgi:hypothetical protein
MKKVYSGTSPKIDDWCSLKNLAKSVFLDSQKTAFIIAKANGLEYKIFRYLIPKKFHFWKPLQAELDFTGLLLGFSFQFSCNSFFASGSKKCCIVAFELGGRIDSTIINYHRTDTNAEFRHKIIEKTADFFIAALVQKIQPE